MLGQEKLVAMLGTSKPDAARAFFEGTLGLGPRWAGASPTCAA